MSEKNGTFEKSQKQYKLNNYEKAFINAKERLSKNPNEYLANLEMGKIFLTARKIEEAIIFFQNANSADPKSDEAQQLLFKSYLISEQDDKALLLTKKSGTNSSWHEKAVFQLNLRNKLNDNNKDSNLIAELESKIKLTTTKGGTLKLRTDIYDYLLNKHSSANLVFELGSKMLEFNEVKLALEDFGNAMTISPNSPKLAVNISKSLFIHKQYRTAKYYAHQARLMNPTDAETLSILGACELELNNRNTALKFLEMSNKLKPHDLFAVINLEKLLDPVTDFEKCKSIYTAGKGISLQIDSVLDNKLALLLVENKEYETAKKLLKSILNYDSKNTDALNNLGNLESLLGNYTQAISFFSEAIAHEHKNKNIPLTGIANSYRKLNKPKLTEKFYREALKLCSNDPTANMGLGSFLSEKSKFGAAIQYLEAALEFSSTAKLKSDSYAHLGLHYYRLGQLKKSEGFYEKSLNFNQISYETLINYGVLLTDLGKFNDAIKEFNKALELKPNSTEAYINLGVALKSSGRTRQSIETLSEAISSDPKSPIAHSNYAAYQRELGNFELAEKHTKISHSLDPSLPQIKNNYANMLKDSGDMTAAIRYYKEAIKSKETYFEARRNLLSLADKNEARMQIGAILNTPPGKFLSEDEKVHKAFALASAYEKIGDQQNFLKHLHEGNALRKKQLCYNFDKDKKLFDTLEKIICNPSLNKLEIKQQADHFQLKETPIFIVGMPRSGSTLVEQILASHPDITGLGELPHLTNAVFESNLIKGDLIETNKITEIYNNYSQNIKSYNITTKYFTDKMPLNFRWIPFIYLAFPNAKIINVHRESMAVCWSIYKHYFSASGNGYAYSLEDIADFYNSYENYLELITFKLPQLNYINFSYDELTRSQEKNTRSLLNYLDLPFDKKCLEFHKNDRSVRTASNSQVRKKMYKNSSTQWTNYESELANLKSKLNRYQHRTNK